MIVSPNTALHRTPAAAPLSPVSFQAFGGARIPRVLSSVATVLLVFGLGCRTGSPPVSRNVPDIQKYKESLTLSTVLPRSEATVGETLDASMSLRNHSREPLEACLGVGRGYHIFGTKNEDGRISTVDHEQCVKQFHLAPGEALEWQEPITIGDVGLGPARLSSWVRVVALEGWHPLYGGYSVSIAAPFVEFNVRPKE